MDRKDKNDYLIQSVSLACSLLEQFQGEEQDLSVTELSRMLRVCKNNVFRLLATLEMRNFVEKNPLSGSYRLGVTSLKLGAACLRSRRFVQEARIPLEAVARLSGETAILAVFGESGLVCEDVLESTQPVRVRTEIGTNLLLQCAAADRIMHAFGDVVEQRPLSGIKPATASMYALSTELNVIRRKGYAISYEEFAPDVCSTAVPVRNHNSKVIGTISVAGPSYRISHERLQCEIAPLVVKCARDISTRLGCQYANDREGALQVDCSRYDLSPVSAGKI